MKNKILHLFVISIVISSVIFSGCVDNDEESKTFYVDKNGGYDFKKIQSALNAASNGDTIIVHEGTYYEVIKINKSVNLIGENKETTIINDYNNTKKIVVQINIDSCVFKGFTVIGPPITSDVKGIDVKSSHNLIKDNVIENTEMGIYLRDNTENNSVINNIILDNKEGISGYRSDNNNISHNEISIDEDISFSLSYGIFLHGCYTSIIYDNSISNCHTGIRLKGSYESLVFDNKIFNNSKGLYCCCGAGNNIIYHNNFEQNDEYNARDDIRNQWDNGIIGNYWGDYIDKYPDAQEVNGIWNTSYEIFDYNNEKPKYDRYPLVNPI